MASIKLAECRPLESWVWHFDMLNDEKRNTAYLLAIRDWARRTHSSSRTAAAGSDGSAATDRSVVLEIGTGSGILSSMVAREVEAAEGLRSADQGTPTPTPPPAEIVAVEVVDEIADCAAATFAGQGRVPIQLVRCHSTALNVAAGAPPPPPPQTPLEQGEPRLLPAPAELVIGELLDTGLLGEGLISSMRDAAARLTTPDFASIPASAVIFAAPIQSEVVWRMGSLRPDREGEPMTGFKSPIEWTRCNGAAAAEGMHVRFSPSAAGVGDGVGVVGGVGGGGHGGTGGGGDGGIEVTPLAPTQPVFGLDFCHLETSGVHDVNFEIAQGRSIGHNILLPCRLVSSRRVTTSPPRHFTFITLSPLRPHDLNTSDGVIHGLVYWWVCNMSGSGAPHPILMSTTPGASPAPDHWRQNVCPLTRPLAVKAGQVLTARARHDEDMVWFEPFDEVTPAASGATATLGGSSAGSGSGTDAHTAAEQQLLPPVCRCGLHTTIPRSRLLALNDTERRTAFRHALGRAYRHASDRGEAESPRGSRGSPPRAVVLGDGLFAPLLAAEARFEVTAVALDARVAALGKRAATASGFGERVEWVLGAEAISDPTDASQTARDVAGALAGAGLATTADLVVAEPFLPGVVADSEGGGVEGWGFDTALLLWSHLFHLAREFDSPAVSPVRAVVRGALYESTELFRLLSPVTHEGSDGGQESRREAASDGEVAAEAAAAIAAAAAGTCESWPAPSSMKKGSCS